MKRENDIEDGEEKKQTVKVEQVDEAGTAFFILFLLLFYIVVTISKKT